MKQARVYIGIMMCMMLSKSLFAADWNVASGSFTNADNWLPSGVPGVGGTAAITNGGIAQFDGGVATNLAAINIGTGSPAALGTLEQSAGTLSATAMPIGSNGGTGTYLMTGGTLDVTGGMGSFSVAPFTNSTGTVMMLGGTLTTASELWIGPTVGGTASFYLNGGTVICKSWGVVGRATGSLATNAWLYINGGSWSNTVANNFCIGSYGPGGVVMSSGTLYALNTLYVAELQPGTMDVYNGTIAANILRVSGNAPAVGRLIVEGGSFWLNQLTKGVAAADISFSGGSLGTRDGNATWSAPITVANTGTGYLTLYGANQAGASRLNTFTGLISGNGAIVVDSSSGQTGTVALAANNTYTGGTTLKGTNTLQLGNANNAGAIQGTLTIENGGNLAFGRTDVVTNNVPVAGTPAAIIQNGTGTLVLTNQSPTFTSAIANSGLFRITDTAAIPGTGASVLVNAGGSLLMDGAYSTVTDWLNSGRIANTSSGTLALSGNSTETIDLASAGSGLYSNIWLGASGNYTYSGNITPVNSTFKFGGGGGSLTVSSSLSGSGTTFDTRVPVSLTGNNSGLTGGVTIKGAGPLITSSANALGSENAVVQNGAVLQVASALTVPGSMRIDNGGLVKVVAGGSIDNVITNNSINGAGLGLGLMFSGPGTLTHSDDVFGTGALIINNNSTLKLDGSQTVSQTDLWVGNNGSAGNLELAGGTLNITNYILVPRGTDVGTPKSTFLLSNGTLNKWNSAGGSTIIGDNRVSVGSMIISNNATFNSFGGNIYVGIGTGIGELIISSGLLHKSANDFLVGTDNGSRGTVKVYGGSISNSAGNVFVGYNAGSIGELTLTNGLFFSQNELDMGRYANSKGTLNITNGTIISGPVIIGYDGTGTVYQAGGSVRRSTNGGEWYLGGNATGVGTLNISGGTFDSAGSNWQIGRNGRGTVNQSGGEISCSQWPVVGRYVRSYGEYNLSGGKLIQPTANKLIIGESGRGVLTVSGTGYADLYGGLSIGHAADGTGTVHLVTGGTISTPIIQKPNATRTQATFNFNGGLLLARSSGATIANFMQGLDAANVLAGGAIIDSSNNTIIVAQNLVTGATPDGGLTKKGTGTLILTGTNTWNGVTTVQAGTLSFAGPESLPSSSTFVVNGGILDLYGRTYTTNAFSMTGGLVNGTFNAPELTLSGNSEIRVKLPSTTLLTKNDSGTAVLAGDSGFTGDITLNQGTLKVQSLPSQPALLTNSLAWFDADDLSARTTDVNGKVATWINKGKAGSLGNAIQVTAGVGPILKPNALNGRTVFNVLGTTSLITTNTTGISGAADRTLFTVGCRQNGNMFLAHMGNGANNNAFGVSSEAGNLFCYTWGGGNDITFGIQPIGGYEMMDFMIESKNATATLYSNNVSTSKSLALPNVNTFNTVLSLGSRPGGTSLGELGEVILFNRALSASERTTVQDYLKAKWFGVGSAALMATTTVDVVTIAANAILNLDGGNVAMASLTGSGLVTNGQAIVTGDVAPGGIGSLNTLTIAGSPVLTGTLRIDVATDNTSDLLKVQGALNLTDLALQVDNTSALRGSKIYKIATFTPGQLTGKFKTNNLAGAGMGVVYDNVAGEIRIISIGTLIRFM